MPDEYGRPTGDDFVKVARGLREYNEGVKKEDEERGFGLGLDALETNPNAQKPTGVSSAVWAKAQDQHGKAKAGRLLADQAGQALEESKLSNEYMALAGKAKTPEERLNILGQINPGTLAGVKALASVQKRVLDTHENQVALFGSVLKKGAAEYDNVVRPALVAANDMAVKGDEEGAAQTLARLSEIVPMRGVFRWNTETKTLDHLFNDRNAGLFPQSEDTGNGAATTAATDGYEPSGRSMRLDEALEYMNGLTKKNYAETMAAHRAKNMEKNATLLESGGHMAVGKGGERLRVVPLVNLDNATRQFAVFDEATGKQVKNSAGSDFFDNDSFRSSGIRIVTKEQRALDNDERKVDLEAAKLGMQREALGLRAEGGGGGQTLAEKYVGLVSKHEAALAQEDPFSEPEARRNIARARALEDVRVLTGDEGIQTEADVSARSRVRGVKPGAAPAQSRSVAPTVSAPPAAAFEGLKPGQTRSFKNTETGEVQAWTVDPVSKQPVRVKNSARKEG